MGSPSAICTLFEGDYHLGAAALLNSLHAAGFRGRVFCGLRGPLPPWAGEPQTTAGSTACCRIGDGLEVHFVTLATGIHFTNFKPEFLLDLWRGPAADADTLFYFDPDIVVKCPWAALARWAEGGVALCEDVNPSLPARHPQRLGWTAFLERHGLPVTASRERYYNAGFLAVSIAQRPLLEHWRDLIAKVGQENGSLQTLKHGAAHALFHTPDQDALNLALMTLDVPVNAVGPEGMDFALGGNYLSHAIGGRKPWRGGFLRQALQGYPPSLAAKNFFRHVDRPISIFSSGRRRRLLAALRLGALIGRFYRRG